MGPHSLRFCRSEEHEHRQFFGDVVEAMADFGGDEDYAAGGNLVVFRAGFESGAAADHVVDFVFAMRLLAVCCSGRENVQPSAHGWHSEKLTVRLAALGALFLNLRQAGEDGLHAKMPPRMRSV